MSVCPHTTPVTSSSSSLSSSMEDKYTASPGPPFTLLLHPSSNHNAALPSFLAFSAFSFRIHLPCHATLQTPLSSSAIDGPTRQLRVRPGPLSTVVAPEQFFRTYGERLRGQQRRRIPVSLKKKTGADKGQRDDFQKMSMPPTAPNHISSNHVASSTTDSILYPSHATQALEHHSEFVPCTDIIAANHDFKFESRAEVVEDRSRQPKHESNDSTRLRCEYHGCTSKRTFRRKYELQRHMKNHTATRIPCVFPDCYKSFYRQDKLKDHVQKHHIDDSELVACPRPTCDFGPVEWDLLKLHIRNHSRHTIIELVASQLIKERHCPVTSCNQVVDVSGLRKHLESHNAVELRCCQNALLDSGYDSNTLNIICPMCRHQFVNRGDWIDHLTNDHFITDSVHYQTICAQLKSIERYPWVKWFAEYSYFDKSIHCNHCSEMIHCTHFGEFEHHLSLLRDPEEIRPYRRAILALWPEFGTHPVFDDVLPRKKMRFSIRSA